MTGRSLSELSPAMTVTWKVISKNPQTSGRQRAVTVSVQGFVVQRGVAMLSVCNSSALPGVGEDLHCLVKVCAL